LWKAGGIHRDGAKGLIRAKEERNMPGGFRNQPKIQRGALVEYGLSIPPLAVVFQFNPLQLSRSRSQSFSVPSAEQHEEGPGSSLREFHQRFDDLTALRDAQEVKVDPESLSFDIRLDATDRLNDGDAQTTLFGIAPQLATLELLMEPKSESELGAVVDKVRTLLGRGGKPGFTFTGTSKPPMVLFIWGLKRVLPVNINSMQTTETEFSPLLAPTRATVAVNLTVIEGVNAPYRYSKLMKEVASLQHLASGRETIEMVIPG
jgi:hypothetical protein